MVKDEFAVTAPKTGTDEAALAFRGLVRSVCTAIATVQEAKKFS